MRVRQRRAAEREKLGTECAREVRALRVTEEQLSKIFSNVMGSLGIEKMVIITDLNHRITYVNAGIENILGYKPEEVIDRQAKEFFEGIPGNPRNIVQKVKREAVDGAWERELLNQRKDGSLISVDLTVNWLMNSSGDHIGCVGIATDITGRKCVEEQLRGYQYHLEEMVRERTVQYAAINKKLRREITERKEAEEALRESESKLQAQRKALERKNIALREILEQIEIEKKQIKDNVIASIEELLLPILLRFRATAARNEGKYITLLRQNLEKLASSFGRKVTEKSLRLTPREIEVCNMIRSGLTSKEITALLRISLQTTERHRNNIRKKLGISHKKINLASYLQSL